MQGTLFTGHWFWPSTATFMEESCVLWFLLLCFTVDQVICGFWGFIFPVSLFKVSRISRELGGG